MGRYSLDQTGLVYADSGNNGFNSTNNQTFPADDDGIVPIMDMDWFPDDAASRFEEFLKVAWTPDTLEENLTFVADCLSSKGGETPRETIRTLYQHPVFQRPPANLQETPYLVALSPAASNGLLNALSTCTDTTTQRSPR